MKRIFRIIFSVILIQSVKRRRQLSRKSNFSAISTATCQLSKSGRASLHIKPKPKSTRSTVRTFQRNFEGPIPRRFQLDVRYKPGKHHVIPDALSRLSIEPEPIFSLHRPDDILDNIGNFHVILVEISDTFKDELR
jgi:hypothetical protein